MEDHSIIQLTPEEEAEIRAMEQRNQAIAILEREYMILFRMFITLWNIGKSKGIWNDTDIDAVDPTIRDKVIAWKAGYDRMVALKEEAENM